jgi:hypothetical protein
VAHEENSTPGSDDVCEELVREEIEEIVCYGIGHFGVRSHKASYTSSSRPHTLLRPHTLVGIEEIVCYGIGHFGGR